MPDVAPVIPPAVPDPEIHTIPEKFYGAALRAREPEATQGQGTDGLVQPAAHRNMLPFILGGVGVLILFAGAFVYFQRDLFFPPTPIQTPVVVEPPPVIQPPTAPTDASATSTNPQSASIVWVDTASNETAFRIERADPNANFQGITTLPANSTSFQDGAVSPSSTYRYRIIAVNQAGESSPSNEVAASVPPLPPPPPEVAKLPPAGLDTDSDGLTDLEEALFSTDVRSPDTDTDGFLDGNEVFHLYNPGGRAPGKLIEAGLVKEEEGAVQWTMNIPKEWTLRQIDTQGTNVVVETGRPETFILTVEQNPDHLSLVDWYKSSHPTVQESQILHYRSKRGYEGIIGADLLTTYIPWEERIFVFTYNLNGQPFINYRTTYSMMLNSLMLVGLPQLVPPVAGTPLPFEPGATTTGVMAQPEALAPASP